MGIFSVVFFVSFEVSWISILKYIVCILIIMQILLDYRFLLLSTNISILIILLGLGLAYLDIKISILESFIGLCLGYTSLWLINFIFKTIKSRDGIGDGDFIFLAALCSVLGYKLIGPIVLGASITSLIIYLISSKENKLLPFGTGMGFSTIFIIFYI
jgi:leader peptidase (prepilin peptidase)/N-methyltransferase